jgi:hypothetical protein
VPIDDVLRLAVESMDDAWAAHPAGSRYKYSNIGYNVLGRIVETTRNESFATYMTFGALPDYGMDRSAYFTGFLADDATVATGYVGEGGRLRAAQLYDLNELASGNLFTSAADLSAFMVTILETTAAGDGPLSLESLQSSYEPQFVSATDPERTGLAWATSEHLAGELMVWHQGGDADANAVVALFPDSRTGVCLLSNTGSYEGVKLLELAVDCLHAVSGTRAAHPVTVGSPGSTSPLPSAEQFTGRYVAWGELIEIKVEGSRIKADFGIAELRMERVGQTALGTEYTVDHWLGGIVADAFPLDLDLFRVIVPPMGTGEVADHLWFAGSDCGFEYCPRYSVPPNIPSSWNEVAGQYDGCEVTCTGGALHMSGIGYLRVRSSGVFEVVGGPLDAETVTRDPQSGALSHQGIVYNRM